MPIGLADRREVVLKLRQPLGQVVVAGRSDQQRQNVRELTSDGRVDVAAFGLDLEALQFEPGAPDGTQRPWGRGKLFKLLIVRHFRLSEVAGLAVV